MRSNRYDFPKDILNQNLEKGSAAFYANEDTPMVACKYRSNKGKSGGQQKIVFMLTTQHHPTMEDVPGQNVPKPTIVRQYNFHMCGEERVDQQLHGFHTLRKSYKWYKKLAFRLLMQMSLNSHKVFQKTTGSSMTFQEFILYQSKLLQPMPRTSVHPSGAECVMPVESVQKLAVE